MNIIFATHNRGKLEELKALFSETSFTVVSADDVGVTEDVVEDGKTFAENALKKARFVHERVKHKSWVVADDSGLCIRALGGAPGVLSRRWAGEDADDAERIRFTLAKIADVPYGAREAYFETALALISPEGTEQVFSARVNGTLTKEPQGEARPHLVYDVIFIPDGYDNTFAQMTMAEKNSMSHRGQAFNALRDFLLSR